VLRAKSIAHAPASSPEDRKAGLADTNLSCEAK